MYISLTNVIWFGRTKSQNMSNSFKFILSIPLEIPSNMWHGVLQPKHTFIFIHFRIFATRKFVHLYGRIRLFATQQLVGTCCLCNCHQPQNELLVGQFLKRQIMRKNNFDGLENHVSYQIAINWMVNHTHFQHWPRRFQHFQRRSSLPPALPLEGSLGLSCLENKCVECVEIRNHFFN